MPRQLLHFHASQFRFCDKIMTNMNNECENNSQLVKLWILLKLTKNSYEGNFVSREGFPGGWAGFNPWDDTNHENQYYFSSLLCVELQKCDLDILIILVCLDSVAGCGCVSQSQCCWYVVIVVIARCPDADTATAAQRLGPHYALHCHCTLHCGY